MGHGPRCSLQPRHSALFVFAPDQLLEGNNFRQSCQTSVDGLWESGESARCWALNRVRGPDLASDAGFYRASFLSFSFSPPLLLTDKRGGQRPGP